MNPGSIATAILEKSMLKWPDRDLLHPRGAPLHMVTSAVSLGGDVLVDAEDVAQAICFLISNATKSICGAEFTVDGGISF